MTVVFLAMLEFGNFEVADDELYAAYILSSKKQGVRIEPRREFFGNLAVRLDRSGNAYLRRARVTGYPAQKHINEYQQLVTMCPQLLGVTSCDIFLGFRIAEGPFGPPIGQAIPSSGEFKRRDVPNFEDGS